jgi:nicotinamide riboside kinase
MAQVAQEAGRRCSVYIIGAQCTGKTTLVNALEDSYAKNEQPLVIREVARTVLREKGFSRSDITSSPSRALELQKHILDAQFEVEKAATGDDSCSPWYICDRSGLDPIVYAQLFVSEAAATEMLATDTWKELERRMKAGIVILCEAGCTWLVDDGTRLMPDGMDEWMRIDSAFRTLLAVRGINYKVIPKDMVSLEERVERVREHLEHLNEAKSLPA